MKTSEMQVGRCYSNRNGVRRIFAMYHNGKHEVVVYERGHGSDLYYGEFTVKLTSFAAWAKFECNKPLIDIL